MEEKSFLILNMNIYLRNMRHKSYLLIVFVISLLSYSCQKDNSYSIIPAIEFSEIKTIPDRLDSVDLVISFTDGDGDIGFTQGDTLPPFNYDPINYNYYYFNFHFVTYHFVDTSWVEYVFPDPYSNGYRIEYITPTGQNKSLKGTIQVGLRLSPAMPDSVYYEIQLVDRALHISNTVQTPVIVK
jgi:hypothetical protein